MRLFLLPVSTKQSLVFCQRVIPQASKKLSWIDRITTGASTKWLAWEKADKGWMKKVTVYGNKLFQRLPHEEWGLKSIPPLSKIRRAKELEGMESVQVEYPESILKQDMVEKTLRKFGAKERQAFHTKWLWASILGMPISLPAGLVPIIPNLPFFYLCFRAWSHWRARSGSKHIEFLLDNQLLKQSPSSILDIAYAIQGSEKSFQKLDAEYKAIDLESDSKDAPSNDLNNPPEAMLLSASSGRLIADCLEAPELEQEIERAVHQIEGALKAKKELNEEKRAMDSATDQPKAKG